MARLIIILCAFILGFSFLTHKAQAEGSSESLPQIHWHFDGITGTYDRGALQRGFQVYREICSSCHSMNLLYYRDLSALGYSQSQIKAIASEYDIEDGPNDEGEMFTRPGLPSDRFKAPYPNLKAAMYANNGATPPDFSLLAKARHGGADYIYAILTGYEDGHDKDLLEGQYWNKYVPGHVIAMAQPLYDDMVEYGDGTPGTLSQYSMDIAEFLSWAAEPHMEARKYTGIKAILFLIVFTGVMFAVKRKVWADVH